MEAPSTYTLILAEKEVASLIAALLKTGFQGRAAWLLLEDHIPQNNV